MWCMCLSLKQSILFMAYVPISGWPRAMPCLDFTCHASPCQNTSRPKVLCRAIHTFFRHAVPNLVPKSFVPETSRILMPRFLAPGTWYQDSGSKNLAPRFWYQICVPNLMSFSKCALSHLVNRFRVNKLWATPRQNLPRAHVCAMLRPP